MTAELTRAAVVACARGWLGTPYRHQASVKGAGCDCLGLVRGVWRELIGPEPEAAPPYRPEWAERGGAETLRDAARRHLMEIPLSAARAGDVLTFRMAAGSPAKHCAILTAPDMAVHAYWGRHVVETWMTEWWVRRAAYAFAFPGVAD